MNTFPTNAHVPTGGARRTVIQASLDSAARGDAATLVIVVETLGSTYVRVGAMALFGPATRQVGWLSGGCLEAEIGERALRAANANRVEWMDIDTREDEYLFSGSATGCRGRLRLALLPMTALERWQTLASDWLDRRGALSLGITPSGAVSARLGATRMDWQLAASAPAWIDPQVAAKPWQIDIPPPPAVLVLGAGPESALLIPVLRSIGWLTIVAEKRERWAAAAALADRVLTDGPADAVTNLGLDAYDAALVMHHNFELDREALVELARHPVAFVGLLGPNRRRDDLFSVMPASAREALAPRVRSPVGLDIGGHGPEAIALSIAAQLHAWTHAK